LALRSFGSFMADIGEAIDPSLCGRDDTCKALACLLIAFRESHFEPAMSQITAAAVAQWNLGQGASLKGIPLTAIGGDAISIRGLRSPYISPNDLLVGIESAQAVGLQASGIIPELACFTALPDVHSNTFLPFVPNVKYGLLDDPRIANDVVQTLAGSPPTPAAQILPSRHRSWADRRSSEVLREVRSRFRCEPPAGRRSRRRRETQARPPSSSAAAPM
jgi:hypothetical protein